MKLEYGDAVSRFTEFMSENVAKVPDLGRRFLMYAALGAMNSNSDVAGARLKGWLGAVGIVDEDDCWTRIGTPRVSHAVGKEARCEIRVFEVEPVDWKGKMETAKKSK